jgi:KDO2-lipid IV(A) lauroyltransferase
LKQTNITYYLVAPFIYLISLLPFSFLYLLSDSLFVIVYYIWGYRKTIVYENLQHSFPDKTKAEIIALRWFYYRYLCDLFLETFKMLTISSSSMLRRCELDQQSRNLLKDLFEKNERAILTLGHKGNWEWAGSVFSLVCQQQFYIVYHPLSNSAFDSIMYKMRSRFGAKLVTMTNAYKTLKQLEDEPILSAFVADQSPPLNGAHWTEFLHRSTPFFRGPERISSKLGQAVLYLSVHRVKRGYYKMHVERLTDANGMYDDGEITERYVGILEEDIISEPQTWLWSHRRWKHIKHAPLGSKKRLLRNQNLPL